jgi:hypothetical protein
MWLSLNIRDQERQIGDAFMTKTEQIIFDHRQNPTEIIYSW